MASCEFARLRLAVFCFGLLGCLTPALAQTDPVVVLQPPSFTNGSVRLTFTGEPEVTYVISQSTNLQDWFPVATNSEHGVTRAIQTPAEADTVYYRVARGPLPLFSSAIMALLNIKFTGSSVSTDSFNSTNALFSTNGWYDSTKSRSNGHVASLGGLISVGSAHIYGDVVTGPTGSVSLGAGSISGQYRNDLNLYLPNVAVSGSYWLPPSPGDVNRTVDGITYAYAFGHSGAYFVDGYNGGVCVRSNVTVKLWVTGTASGRLFIQQGGALTLYMSGGSYNFLSGITNQNPDANSFQYYGQESNTNIGMSLTQPTGGVLIYAPQAALNMNASGGDFSGAIVAKSVSVNGGVAFHFDESLLSTGPTR